jgi:hypothetical protein
VCTLRAAMWQQAGAAMGGSRCSARERWITHCVTHVYVLRRCPPCCCVCSTHRVLRSNSQALCLEDRHPHKAIGWHASLLVQLQEDKAERGRGKSACCLAGDATVTPIQRQSKAMPCRLIEWSVVWSCFLFEPQAAAAAATIKAAQVVLSTPSSINAVYNQRIATHRKSMPNLRCIRHKPEVNAAEASGLAGRCKHFIHIVHCHAQHLAIASQAGALLLDL